MQTKKQVVLALFTTIALTLFWVEAQIPLLIPVQGVKLGLSNVVTLVALAVFGWREAGTVLLMRIILGALLVGNASTIIYSGLGGIFAFLVMSIGFKWLKGSLLWVLSVLGAIGHNVGQLIAAALVMRTNTVFLYAPLLVVSAVITGAFTGLCAVFLLKHVKGFVG